MHHIPSPEKFGRAAQELDPVDEYYKTTKDEVLQIQQVVGSILYYAQAAYLTAFISLPMIASEQAEAMKKQITNTK